VESLCSSIQLTFLDNVATGRIPESTVMICRLFRHACHPATIAGIHGGLGHEGDTGGDSVLSTTTVFSSAIPYVDIKMTVHLDNKDHFMVQINPGLVPLPGHQQAVWGSILRDTMGVEPSLVGTKERILFQQQADPRDISGMRSGRRRRDQGTL
jgi:hypothetical protein